MEIRSLFAQVFGKGKAENFDSQLPNQQQGTYFPYLKTFTGWQNVIVGHRGNVYDTAYIRSIVHCIASHCAKLQSQHVINLGNGRVDVVDDNLTHLLNVRPNHLMTPYNFIYRIKAQLLVSNNAFVYIRRDAKLNVSELYPLSYELASIKEHPQTGEIYVEFQFMEQKITVPYTSLIHIRGQYCQNDLVGDDQGKIVSDMVNTADCLKQGVQNIVKANGHFTGILKINTNLKQADIDDAVEKFTASFGAQHSVAAVDNKMDYQAIATQKSEISTEHLNYAKKDILQYFGLSAEILSGKFNEEEWSAFYMTHIEPFSAQLTQEFSAKLLTDVESRTGHQLLFGCNQLLYASLQTKTNLIKEMRSLGVLSINESRGILGLPMRDEPECDELVTSLNFVPIDMQKRYQLSKSGMSKDEVDAVVGPTKAEGVKDNGK